MKTAKRVRRFVEHNLLDPGQAFGGDPLAEGLLDSLAIEQLIAFAEDTYHIEFEDEELIAENFATIDTVARLIDGKASATK